MSDMKPCRKPAPEHHDAVGLPERTWATPFMVSRDGGRTRLADDIRRQRTGDVEEAADGCEGQEAIASREGHEQATEHGVWGAEHTVDDADHGHDDDLHQREADDDSANIIAVAENRRSGQAQSRSRRR